MTREIALPAACAVRYRPLKLLASGGFGAVYVAEQVGLARMVAVKVLHVEALADREAVFRFKDEARVTASISHPHVVVILDHGVDDGLPWIVYELLQGPTLRAIVEKGPVDWHAAADVGIQVAGALEAAHALGVVHRDIKPENVIQAWAGTFKVTDFGLAKWAQGQGLKTRTGIVMGTPAYIPPEQIRGEAAGPGGDIYSLGIMLYEMVAGRVPFDAASPTKVLAMHLESEPKPIETFVRGVPKALEDIILSCLVKDPRGRLRSAKDVGRALSDLMDPSRGRPTQRIVLRHRHGARARARPSIRTGIAVVLGTLFIGLLAGRLVLVSGRRAGGIGPGATPVNASARAGANADLSAGASVGARAAAGAGAGAGAAESAGGGAAVVGSARAQSWAPARPGPTDRDLDQLEKELDAPIDRLKARHGALMEAITVLDLSESSSRANLYFAEDAATAKVLDRIADRLWAEVLHLDALPERSLRLLTRACAYDLLAQCQQRRDERLAEATKASETHDGVNDYFRLAAMPLEVYGRLERDALDRYCRTSLALARQLVHGGVDRPWLAQFLDDHWIVAHTQRSAEFTQAYAVKAQDILTRWHQELAGMREGPFCVPPAQALIGIWDVAQPQSGGDRERVWAETREGLQRLATMAPSARGGLAKLMSDVDAEVHSKTPAHVGPDASAAR